MCYKGVCIDYEYIVISKMIAKLKYEIIGVFEFIYNICSIYNIFVYSIPILSLYMCEVLIRDIHRVMMCSITTRFLRHVELDMKLKIIQK